MYRGIRSREFRFKFFDGGEAALEFFREFFEVRELSDAQRLGHVAQRVFRDDAVLFLAQDQADAGFVIGVAQQIIYGGKLEVHLAGVLRLERAPFEVEDHVAAELEVIEEQVDPVFLAGDFQRDLAAYECEAQAEFKDKFLNVADKTGLQFAFVFQSTPERTRRVRLGP